MYTESCAYIVYYSCLCGKFMDVDSAGIKQICFSWHETLEAEILRIFSTLLERTFCFCHNILQLWPTRQLLRLCTKRGPNYLVFANTACDILSWVHPYENIRLYYPISILVIFKTSPNQITPEVLWLPQQNADAEKVT